MKAKHYYMFNERILEQFQGNSLNKDNWDILRIDDEPGPFSIERDIESYERTCMSASEYEYAAEQIQDLLMSKQMDARKMISLGAGKGILEWHLKRKMPEMIIECTDYTVKAVQQLKSVFKFLDAAYPFDMLKGDYSLLDENAVFLMYRVSTEFGVNEWYSIFESMHKAQILSIIFVPTELASLGDMIGENIEHIKNVMKGKRDICCGWLYSEREFLKIFKGKGNKALYVVKDKIYFDNTAIFVLERN